MDGPCESDALRAAALAVSGAAGDAVFRELVQVLARILGVQAAMIGIFADDDRARMRALATWLDGRLLDSFEYALAGTPCAGVVGREFRYVKSGAAPEFQPGTLFHARGIDAYSAYSLNAPGGEQLGLIVAMDRHPLPDASLVEPLLKIFAVRAVAEIERARAESALKSSEASYRAIFEASEDAIFVHDWESGAFLEANARACEMYGYTVDELRAGGVALISAPEPEYSRERALELIERAKAQPAPVRFEWLGRHKDGHPIAHEVTLKQATLAGRRRVLAFVRDITKRKAADEALAASEAQYRAMFNASADALVLWDSSLRRVDVNPAYERVYGWRRDEVVGRAFEDRVMPAGYAEQRLSLLLRSLAGETCRVELEALRKTGERFTAEVTTIPFVHRGEPHVMTIVRDITGRKLAEEALRASEEQYRAIFNATADALVLRDADFRIVDVNRAYEAMSGYARDEVLCRTQLIANPPEMEAEIRGLHARALAGETVTVETVRVRKDGRRSEVELRGVPIRHRGAPHVLYIGRDISERRMLEARLRQAQKMEALGQLTGGIAHDFNNLLAGIMGYVVLAEERVGPADSKLNGYLEQALASCRRARDLIAQMLTFSRGQRGRPRPLPLAAAVEQSISMLRGTLPSTLELRTALDPAPVASHDPVHVGQVVMNLLINARDAVAGVGRVEVVLRPTRLSTKVVCASCRKRFRGDFVELAVSDTGPGIATPLVERIFEPFFTTKEVGRGSGMGLAMVHGIVHEHHGHILVETAPGQGSCFRVLLPALDPAAAEERQAENRTSAARRAPLAGRVLVVDDEAPVGEFMRELLESWGLSARVVSDPLAVPAHFSRNPRAYDLAILDQTMPGMTGMRLAQELLALRPGLPILLYSGHGHGIAERDMQAAGIRALVHKPVEPDLLYGLLKAHLH
jgi:PAS domain S-box-containing protein